MRRCRICSLEAGWRPAWSWVLGIGSGFCERSPRKGPFCWSHCRDAVAAGLARVAVGA